VPKRRPARHPTVENRQKYGRENGRKTMPKSDAEKRDAEGRKSLKRQEK